MNDSGSWGLLVEENRLLILRRGILGFADSGAPNLL
jgi:hypothetical protein